MKLRKLYAAFLTRDLAAAEVWYTHFFGRRPDNRPMTSLVQWELLDGGSFALSTDDEIAGPGAMFLIVDDLEAERDRLQQAGIALGDDIAGDYSTLAQVKDPDGNTITLASPPSPAYPPA